MEKGNNKRKKIRRIPEQENNNMDETKTYKIKRKKGKKHPKLWKTIKITILVMLIAIIIASGIIIGKLYGICKEAKLDMEDVIIEFENSVVKDIAGDSIAVLSGDENRDPVPISEMSEYLPKAFVAIEDERFYEHSGVDVKRTGAATLTYILNGGESSFGGSTITQQMVKNITDEDDRTWKRKVKEMARAYYIEQEMSKSQILELYLNLIFLGGKSYGVEVASHYYFSKSAKDLTLTESAFLAGINNSPNRYDAFSTDEEDITKVRKRVKTVLDKMRELGKEGHKAGITEQEYQTAIAELEAGIVFAKGTITQNNYSYHTEAAINQVKKELKEKYGYTDDYVDAYVKSGGLTIYTTQNTVIQQVMEEEVKKGDYVYNSKYHKDEDGNYVTTQTAMVLIDHKTGYVLGTIGGIGEKTTSFGLNRATQSLRQTGSSMKPLAVLCPGIDKGIITAGSVYDDITYSSGKYAKFRNYGGSSRGLITLRYATAHSQNIPMLKAISDIGIENSIEFLKSAGITTLDPTEDTGLSLALGGLHDGISPLEMAGAYAAIANDGVYIEPTFYTKVVDNDGKVILEANQETRTIMSSSTAYIVKEMLTEVVRSGTLTSASISGMSVAAKTGTTSETNDLWTCGFTPYYTGATWFGFDLNETINYKGINPAGRIWSGVMKTVHSGLEGRKFSDTRPTGVTTAYICKSSGKIATELCQKDPRGNQAYTEYFIKGTVPKEQCTCHVEASICLDAGIIANAYCPNIETRVYITRPETETGNWQNAKDAEYMLQIKDVCPYHIAPQEPEKPEVPEKPDTGSSTGGNTSGGNTTGGNTTGGNTTGGNTTGGNTTDGNTTGGNTTGGNTTGGNTTDGNTTGGNTTGGNTTSGNTTDGNTTGENATSGSTTEENTTGGNTTGTDTPGGSIVIEDI